MSGRKDFITSIQVVSSGDMSGNLTSTPINIQMLDDVGVMFVASGSPTGTFTAEVSTNRTVNADGSEKTAGDWADYPFTSAAAASGSAINIFRNMATLSAPWIRFKYTFTSGTGTLNAYITGKMI